MPNGIERVCDGGVERTEGGGNWCCADAGVVLLLAKANRCAGDGEVARYINKSAPSSPPWPCEACAFGANLRGGVRGGLLARLLLLLPLVDAL